MDSSDKNQFKALFDGLGEYYRAKEPLSKIALGIYFGALQKYTFDQVSNAVSAHVIDQTSGKFYPKAGDLIKHLEGGEITADIILASAKLAKTPLGILARIHIGTWDLNSGDSFYLNSRAKECLLLMPEWQERARQGEYSGHEISIMIKHNVNPIQPFFSGIAGPQLTHELDSRIKAIQLSNRHKELTAPNYTASTEKPNEEQLQSIRKVIKQLDKS